MTTLKHVAVEADLAVRRIIARYCQLLDDREHAAAAGLFTEDGRFRVDGQDLRGRAAIGEWLVTLSGELSHSVTNVVVSNASQPGSYHAVSDLVLSGRGKDGRWSVTAHGRYHDTVVGEGRDMRFAQRILTLR